MERKQDRQVLRILTGFVLSILAVAIMWYSASEGISQAVSQGRKRRFGATDHQRSCPGCE